MTTLLDTIRKRHGVKDGERVGVAGTKDEDMRVDEGSRSFTAIANTASVDLVNEVVVPEGADLTYFATNKTILYNHDHNLPIGKLRVRPKLIKRNGGSAWLIRAGVSPRNSFARDVFDLMADGVIQGVSVGFIADEFSKPTQEEIEAFGQHDTTIRRWRWLETSVTAMPCNPAANIQEVSKSAPSHLLSAVEKRLGAGTICRKTAEILGHAEAKPTRTVVLL